MIEPKKKFQKKLYHTVWYHVITRYHTVWYHVITQCDIFFVEKFFFGSINSPDPPDHLPMLEASEIPVEML